MIWQKKIARICALLFFALAAASCDGSGCVEADEFANNTAKVESNPVSDGVFGIYDDSDGGQIAEWHNTGFRTNGEDLILLISGAWTPWYGSDFSDAKMLSLDRCTTCAKRNNNPDENCICYDGQIPEPEIGPNGVPVAIDCDVAENQNNPNLCTCTTLNGNATDYGVFHFPLAYYNKDHSQKLPDEQDNVCKYDRGMGLFLGAFGRTGSESPIRAYHLFSQESTCAIVRNAQGECVDEQGVNRLKYIFRSANTLPLVKDDMANNSIVDPNPEDDEFHLPNEYLKLIIYDRFYSDNFGHYNVQFLKGVASDGETGLLEFLVNIVEEQTLGKFNNQGVREGGTLEFMYKALTQDSYFIASLQLLLIIYIAFFGIMSLMGLVELTKKEIYGRILKISVVVFFTSPSSWEFYRQFLVGTFKDSMDFVITLVLNLSESNLVEDQNPLLIAAQGSSSNPGSAATRFSYIDGLIRMLFSDAVTQKIWGLFFSGFGILYILAIYALIAYFIYVMLVAAMIYAVTLLKLILVLSLGPIFISFSLFKLTNEMFKKWLAFCGARSIEMVILFLVLYMLVLLVDQQFNALLYFQSCFENINIGLFSFDIIRSYHDRSFIEWTKMLLTLAGFIFLIQSVLTQIPKLAQALITIGGASGGINDSKLASGLVGQAFDTAYKKSKQALSNGGGMAFQAARKASQAVGLSKAIDKVGDKIPFRNPRTMLRDSVVDEAIRQGQVDADSKKLTGAARDRHVRNFALNNEKFGLHAWRSKNKDKAALYDLTAENMRKRIDQKLIEEPLKKFLKNKAKSLKQLSGEEVSGLLGKDMNKRLKSEARNWADNNLGGERDSINDYLHNMKDFIGKHGKLSSKEAAKKFAGSDKLKENYLQHLKNEAIKKGKTDAIDSKKVQDFMGRAYHKEDSPLNPFEDKSLMNQNFVRDSSREAMHKAMRNALVNGKAENDKKGIKEYYENKINDAEGATYKRDLQRKMEKKFGEIDTQRKGYIDTLRNGIRQQVEQEKINGDVNAMREKAQKDYDDILKEHQKIIGADGWQDKIANNGGWANYRDGLVDFNGNTVLEAKTRLDCLGSVAQDTATSSFTAPEGLEPAQGQGTMQQAQEFYNAQLAKEETEKVQFLPENFEIKIGASIGDALALSEPDIGLKAGDITLGTNQSESPQVDQSLLNACEMKKMQSDLKARAVKWDKKQAEYKLSLEQSKGNEADQNMIKSLTQEIESADNTVNQLEREIGNIDSQITDIKNTY